MEKLTDNTQRLLSCVFQNRADEAIAILRQGDFDRAILDDAGLTDVPLPLYRITECFAILLDLVKGRECTALAYIINNV